MNRIGSTSGGRPAGLARRRPWLLGTAAALAVLVLPLSGDGTILQGCQKPCAELAGATVRATSLAPHDTVALVEKALLALLRLGQGRVSDALDALHDYTARLNALAAAKKPRISARDHARLTASVDAALACVQGVGNAPPVANAGTDQTVPVGATVQLSGSKSSDVDGDPLSYAWSFVSGPAGSEATLTSPSSVTTSFLVDLPGTYVVQLLVHDGTVESGPATVRISTVNSPPIASAGPDQTVTVGSIVQLDGAASFDVDGDPLSFEWTLASRPPGSQATLTDPTAERPAFIADVGGTYVVQLVVNDGLVDSQAAAVRIDTQNSPPVSDPGPDQIVPVGSLVQLDATGSSDADGDPLTFRWSFTTRPAGSAAVLSDPTGALPTFVADVAGTYVVQLVVNDGLQDGAPDTVMVTAQPVNQAPGVDAGPDATITLPADSVGLSGSVADDGLPGGLLTITWSLASGPATVTFDSPSAAATTARFSASGAYVLRLTADDGALSSSDLVTVTVNPAPAVNQPPVVSAGADHTITLPAAAALAGTVSDDGRPDPPGAVTATWSVVSGPGAVTFGDALALTSTATFSTAGSYVLRLSAFDGLLTATADVTITVNLPPDPATVAPPVDQSVITTLKGATEFLYTGANPIQTGVAPGTIDPKRAAVLRGRVLDGNGAPLGGVTVTILGHPEFGQTLTRADGMFDLAINGGGQLTINYEKAGVLPAQRQAATAWSDYTTLPDVVLIALDPEITVIDLGANVPMQVVRGRVMTDADGTRRATLLVPQGTTAEMRLPGGGVQPLPTLSARATEYTVGRNGPQAMPAELPATSAYTYAVELSADEALAAGATEVRFSSPLPFYVENFLDFPVGTIVPLGSYDRTRGLWEASDSGRVIRILGVTGGLADLDVTGDGVADTGAALAALSITDAERQQLAVLYTPGQSLWRVRIPHFTPWDLNWGIVPPPDAVSPDQDPEPDEKHDCKRKRPGSIIGCQDQTLGEAVGVVGTPFGLHYQSDRTPGSQAAYSLEIPLTGGQIPQSLLRIELVVIVAGQMHVTSVPAAADLRTAFVWDGKDAYGRPLQGAQPIVGRLGYTYRGVYGTTSRFGYSAGGSIDGSRARRELTLWRTWRGTVGGWDARAAGLGGWTLSAHHTYDVAGQVLYRGDGERQSGTKLGPVITTFAGTGSTQNACFGGDGGPATGAVVCPRGLAVGPDGSLYIAGDLTSRRIRRVAPDGTITTVAGTGVACSPSTAACGDFGPATQARFVYPRSVAVGPDGSLYIADSENRRVRRVGPDGIITTVAGNGNLCPAPTSPCGDGGPATLATVGPQAVAIGPDGTVYIGDLNTRRVRRVDPDGTITTVAGTGNFCSPTTSPCGDGGPARLATLFTPDSLAVGRDGSLYIGDSSLNRLRRVSPSGLLTTIAGTGADGFSGDGGPATQATFRSISAVAVDPEGSVYVIDRGNNRVRWLRPDGTINTLAGTGASATSGDGGPAARAALRNAQEGLAVGPDGSVYIAQVTDLLPDPRIRRISSGTEGLPFHGTLAAAEDGSEVYLFGPGGRHLRTVDALTGALRLEFAYDATGRLAGVTDGDGNVTTIERDGAGRATAIVAPFGQRTALAMNTDGYLASISWRSGEVVQAGYTAAGLLTTFTSPRGHTSEYGYDALGRLIAATDPTRASQTLARTGTNRDYTVTFTSPLGHTTTYRVQRLGTGELHVTTTSAAAGQVRTVIRPNGTQTAALPDGTTIDVVLGPDPRWRMQAPVATSVTVRTPGGRTVTRTRQRTMTLTDPSDLLSLGTFTEATTVNGLTDTVSYDAATRGITRTSRSGRRGTLVLDAKGRPVQTQDATLHPTTFTYDGRGRLDTSAQGAGASARVTRFRYGAEGYLAGVTDPAGRTTELAIDASGRVTEQREPGGAIVRFGYDVSGNLMAVTPPGQPAHAFTYTDRDETSLYRPPVVGTVDSSVAFTHDPDRRPLRVDRPGGETIDYRYDTSGRLRRIDLPSGFDEYGYDSAGRLISIDAGGDVALAHAYDAWLPTGITWSGAVAGTVSRTFDDNFRVSSQSVNGANPVAIAYDGDGLLSQVGVLAVTRNAQTGLVTATTLGTITDATTYDGFGAVATFTASRGGSPVYGVAYTRDALGRITGKTETVNGTTRGFLYAYDPAGQLAEVRRDGAVVATYAYDGNGNRLTVTGPGSTIEATYDAQDRLTQYGDTAYAYTAAGELRSTAAEGGTTVYRYDGLGTLTSVTLSDGRQIDYLVDGQGRRLSKSIDGIRVQGLLYQDDLRPVAELDGSGAVRSRFVYADRGNVPAYLLKDGSTYRVIVDHLGSPRLVMDVASGVVAQELDYDAFGTVVVDTNPGFQPFGFAGGLYDPDTRLVRFGARDYDAETGRWTTKDPIGFLGGDTNLYGYVLNDPVNAIDVLGLVTPPDWILLELLANGVSAAEAPGLAARLSARYGGYHTLRSMLARAGGLRFLLRQSRIVTRPGQAGFISAGLMVRLGLVAVSFAGGYYLGGLLDETFCLSDKISDFLIELTQVDPGTEHAFQQFVENRRGGLSILDVAEFTERCGGRVTTAFCAGLAPSWALRPLQR